MFGFIGFAATPFHRVGVRGAPMDGGNVGVKILDATVGMDIGVVGRIVVVPRSTGGSVML